MLGICAVAYAIGYLYGDIGPDDMDYGVDRCYRTERIAAAYYPAAWTEAAITGSPVSVNVPDQSGKVLYHQYTVTAGSNGKYQIPREPGPNWHR